MSKLQIRQGLFETNSSTTHTITMANKSEYDAWNKGEVLFNLYEEKFLPVEQAIEENIKILSKSNDCEGEEFEKFVKAYRETKSISDALSIIEKPPFDESDIDWYELYLGGDDYYERLCEYYETYTKEFTTENGDTVVAFGYYGNDY